jgi:hypothetical protein
MVVVVDSSLIKFGTSLLFAMYIILCPKMTFFNNFGADTFWDILHSKCTNVPNFNYLANILKLSSEHNILLPFVPFYKLSSYC